MYLNLVLWIYMPNHQIYRVGLKEESVTCHVLKFHETNCTTAMAQHSACRSVHSHSNMTAWPLYDDFCCWKPGTSPALCRSLPLLLQPWTQRNWIPSSRQSLSCSYRLLGHSTYGQTKYRGRNLVGQVSDSPSGSQDSGTEAVSCAQSTKPSLKGIFWLWRKVWTFFCPHLMVERPTDITSSPLFAFFVIASWKLLPSPMGQFRNNAPIRSDPKVHIDFISNFSSPCKQCE